MLTWGNLGYFAMRRPSSRAERYDWYNKDGRYAAPGAISRTLPVLFMTEQESRRRDKKTEEFSVD
jgi:hypothetical protein